MSDTRPPLGHLALKSLTRLRYRGPRDVAELLGSRLKEALGGDARLIMHVRDNDAGSSPSREANDAHVAVREATPADGAAYSRFIGTDSARTFRARLSGSTRCYLVVSQDKVLHASWVTTAAAWTRELGRYICPPPGDAYVYESFTRSDARGRGLYPLALRAIAASLAEAGVARAWVAVEADNAPSLKAVAKAGFEPAFQIPYRRRLARVDVGQPIGPLARMAPGFVGCKPP